MKLEIIDGLEELKINGPGAHESPTVFILSSGKSILVYLCTIAQNGFGGHFSFSGYVGEDSALPAETKIRGNYNGKKRQGYLCLA